MGSDGRGLEGISSEYGWSILDAEQFIFSGFGTLSGREYSWRAPSRGCERPGLILSVNVFISNNRMDVQ